VNLEYYINKTKFSVTGGILECELDDDKFAYIIEMALQELNRFYDSTQLVQVGSEKVIDLKKVEEDNKIQINSVSAIYRVKPNGTTSMSTGTDPMLLSQWNLANNYYNYGSYRWIYNYLAYNTTQQVSNTLSTDLDFKEDKLGRKLYVNFTNGDSSELVIEYVPRLTNVEQVIGDYWIDILSRLSLAYAKIALGRIRTRYKQENAQWSQDGESILAEGKEELKAIEERLAAHANLFYPLD
jgi:hypothetical protein